MSVPPVEAPMSKANGDGREDEAGVQNEQKTQHARLSSTALRLLACLLRLCGRLAARHGHDVVF